ncbi:hypothetical protein [Polaromonas sp.]|jgi:hypothetical protein|uniref:hypothetical protein n=1 Tax=Polaromonas sp. TaxID=1869339 RepID=UPI002C003B90|nr:hypothetical protein [Polaromonas sp.]HQS31354.1 hypothetical protein [Polaromonas sp.]HQS90655.1 hypothetical protein [Polaromonas sp.]
MIMQRLRITPGTAIGLTRMVFGGVCLTNALFHFNPAYQSTFLASLAAAWAPGQPGWLVSWGHINAVGVSALGAELVVNAMAALELVLALSLLTGVWLHRLAWVGIAYNLWLWSTVGGLGGPYTSGATDPGTTIVYALAFALVLLTHAWRPLRLFHGGPTQEPDRWKLRLGEIAFALLWAFDAYWKWQPEFLLNGVNNLTAAQAGQPAWIVAYIGVFIRVIDLVGPVIFGVTVALAESAIALALLMGVALQWILPLGAVYSFVLWTTGEGWGGPYAAGITGNKGDVLGTGIIYVLLFLMLMTARAERAARKRALTR